MRAEQHLAKFSCEVSPPVGHPLCGGWIEPVRAVDDPLRAMGVVLLGSSSPVVLCAVDWCGIRNEAHTAWREALAKAAHTTADRVAVHCVHPHNAPFADTEAQKLIEAAKGPISLDLKYHARCVEKTAAAVKASLARTVKWTHVGVGQAKVDKVASNRRVVEEGKVKYTRTSATKDPKARAEPEGLVDPYLKTLSFWDGDKALAALNYYATHPMSYYGDGRVTSDFCGLARDKRAQEDGKVFQVYFTGCAGNVTAGKYNDGSKENRAVLRDRILTAMRAAWKDMKRHAVDSWAWRVEKMKFSARKEKSFSQEESKKALEDTNATKAKRNNGAYQLAWLKRIDRPVELTCLDFGDVLVLHLPGEPFIEYQLAAQKALKDKFVCVAGYGDGGMGYVPTDKAFLEGGYEPTVALAAPCEKTFLAAITKLLRGKG
jgi:hypothetical protein